MHIYTLFPFLNFYKVSWNFMQMFKRSCLGYEKREIFVYAWAQIVRHLLAVTYSLTTYKHQHTLSSSLRLRSTHLVLAALVLDTVGVPGLSTGSNCIGGAGFISTVICNNQISLSSDRTWNRIDCSSFPLNSLPYCCSHSQSCRRWDTYLLTCCR